MLLLEMIDHYWVLNRQWHLIVILTLLTWHLMFVSAHIIKQFVHTNACIVLWFVKVLKRLAGKDWVVLRESRYIKMEQVCLEFDVHIDYIHSLALGILTAESIIRHPASLFLGQPLRGVIWSFLLVSHIHYMLYDFVEIIFTLFCLY